jgi:RNA polymerase sigma-70 factor (ECF subfamily)
MPAHSPGGADELRLHLLVLRCQSGDERAFAQLFDRLGGRTLAYLVGLVGGDAEDVQQEVWLAVYRGVRGLANPGAFRTWLFQTTRHRAIDFLRRRKRERELLETAAVDASWSAADETGDTDKEPPLPEIMARLAAPHREVLLLCYQDDMSYAEIALVVGCSVGTVKSRLHHARRRARELAEQRR